MLGEDEEEEEDVEILNEEEDDIVDSEPDGEGPGASGKSSGRIFDTNIPTAHKYLGKLENISGYTLFEDGQVIELPALYTNTLAFPGFTLPLVLSHTEQDVQTGFNFVLIWLFKDKNIFFEYGVIMEVFERSIEGDQVNIKARGRQRCFIIPPLTVNAHRQISKAKVKVLEEGPITSPLCGTQLAMLRLKFPYKGEYKELSTFERYRKIHLGQFTFPSWVYDLYEVDYYVEKIVRALSSYYVESSIPRDPTVLSFWFGQNFQLTNKERLMLLQSNTTLERLQYALKYLKTERNLCCAHCDTVISHQNDVFAMSKDGLQSNYVNPGGVVFETVTVKKVANYRLHGMPCKEFSWFPGYAWTILKCSVCGGHLGWMFTARNLVPNKFYGLARSCLNITINETCNC